MRIYIKFLFIIMCAIYIHSKLLNTKFGKKDILAHIVFILLIPTSVIIVNHYTPFIIIFLIVSLLIVHLSLTYNLNVQTSICSTIISLALSYFLFYFSVIFTVIPITITAFAINNIDVLNSHYAELQIIFHTVIGLIQIILARLVFKLKYFKKASTIVLSLPHNVIGTLLGAIILLAASAFHIFNESNFLFLAATLFFGGIGFLLFYWWRNRLKNNYITELHKKEILVRDEEIELLKKDNERLSALIHKDNKLIPALELTVREFISINTLTDNFDTISDRACELLNELSELSSQRLGIIKDFNIETQTQHLTGVVSIDSMLNYMLHKATNAGITLDTMFLANVRLITEHIIPKEQLSAIIADLLENAIIATKEQSARNILLFIGTENSHYCVYVFDSGVPFEHQTLLKLGTERTTTHANDGGSGIGLMNTLSIAKKQRASFYVDEQISDNTYTKKVGVCFNGLKQVVLKPKSML